MLKCVKEVVVFTILTLSLALQAQEEDNSRLDELGQVPRRHIAFNGSLENSGEEACDWDGKHWAKIKSKAQWCKARGGDDAAMRLGCGEGVFPFFSNMTLGDEWTMVGVVKGIEKENAIIWSLGSARGRGTQAFALASGKNGVKVVQWHGAQKDAQMLVMKDVEHFARQFHVYALVKNADGLQLWVDGKKAGESAAFINDGLGWELTFGAFHWAGKAGGLETGDGVEIDDFRVYDTALSEVQLLQIASGNQPWPEGLPRPKERVSAYVDTNAVLRLGYEIPERVTVGGEDGEKRLYAKGVLAQCGIGGEKRFELKSGGAFALGSKGFVFDSNYAHSRTNEIVFAGGAFAAYEPTFIKSAAPIKLSGKVKIITNKQLLVRASIEGDGDLIKAGGGILGLQYPCDNATGRIVVTNASQLVIGPAGSWGGTIVLGNGGTLKCVSTNQVGRIITLKGGKVVESEPGKTFGKDAFPQPATAYRLDKMQKERMGRGVYAVRTKKDEVMVGWRYKSTDPADIAFNVYANGRKLNAEPIRDVTYFKAPWSGEKTKYTVTGVLPGGREGKFAVSASWTLPANAPVGYFDIELAPPPESIMPDGKKIGHHPCDTSIGDLDGDGEYELVIIWWPDNAADNSSWHATGETWIEGVKLDGTNRSLWKINLGKNIRSGSNYVPVMVCDMNGD
ncbi:MAG: hypothetical protein IJ802_01170, partial [Kiritimatiellae bacterium]|nr:hypothetical protein [Kiritimatiellia bacterium]